MKSPEEFFVQIGLGNRPSSLSPNRRKVVVALEHEVRRAANLGLSVFPVPRSIQWIGEPERLKAEASCQLARLEELAAEYPSCTWRAASLGFCVVRLDGGEGRGWFVSNNEDQGECRTLAVVRAQTIWAIFRLPAGIASHNSDKQLANGVRVLGSRGSFPIPPSPGSTWADPSADIEALPYWIREIVFDPSDAPSGRSTIMANHPVHLGPCRSRLRVGTHHSVHAQYPPSNLARWRRRFCSSRRR